MSSQIIYLELIRLSDNFKAALDGVIQGWILDVIYKFFKWIG